MADTRVMIGTGLAAVLIVIATVLIAVMIGKINAANIIGEVRQSDCGLGVLELDTLRYNVHEAIFSDFNESVKGVALAFFIIVFIAFIIMLVGLVGNIGEYRNYIIAVAIGVLVILSGFGSIAFKSKRSSAPNLEAYDTHLKKVSEYLGKLKGHTFDASSGFADNRVGMLGQAQLNPEGAKVKNQYFSLPLYILQQRLLSRIQSVEDKQSSLETEAALEGMGGADIFKYIAFETDADLLLETLAAYDSNGKPISSLDTYNEQKTKELNTVIKTIGLTVDNIKDYKAGLEALKDTSFAKIRTEVNDMLSSLKWVLYISSGIMLFAVYMFIVNQALGGDSFWLRVAFGVVVCIHITLYSFIG